jgi:acetamidase/formamidase
MRRFEPDVLYTSISIANAVTGTVRPGEVFEVRTVSCRGRQFDTHTGRFDPSAPGGPNPSTGCIAVEGAQAGQVLVVHVLGIELDEYGFTELRWPGKLLPQLANEAGWEPLRKVARLRDGYAEWSDRLRIRLAPMIGFLGTAPAGGQSFHNGHNGLFGGNFDVQEIAPGARVHLPVNVEGALLHVGDVHAVQGDGEIDGTGGIESAGIVRLKVELADRPTRFGNPRIQTDDWIATIGFARPAEEAFSQALADLIHWMVDEFGFAPAQAHTLLAQVLEARATQFVNPLISYVCKVRRRYLQL